MTHHYWRRRRPSSPSASSRLLLTIFGLLYVGAGLSAARLHEATKAERPLTVWLAALAVVGSLVSLTALTALPAELSPLLIVQVLIGVVLSAVVTLRLGVSRRRDDQRLDRPGDAASSVGRGRSATSILFGFRLIFPALSLVPFGPDSRPFLALLAYISLDGVGAAHRRLRSRTADAGGLC